MERTCRYCSATGEVGNDFHPKQGNTCRACVKKHDTTRRLAIQAEGGERHERRKEAMRIAQAVQKFGVTHEEARLLYATEGCQICGQLNPGGRRLNIDHCHSTEVVRGVLCNRCNRGLGFFLDSADLLEAAAHYIRNPPIPNIKEHSAVGDRLASLGPVSHGAESD